VKKGDIGYVASIGTFLQQFYIYGIEYIDHGYRVGMKRRTVQALGDYYEGQTASCALGAAYEAMYRLPNEAGGQRPTRDLDWFFDCLDTVKPCPGDACKKRLYLAALLVHLNDDHRWSREHIADWLAGTAKTSGT
jgi:hypothetical protein